MTSNENASIKESSKNALYLVFRLNSEDRSIIRGMYDNAAFMKNDSGEWFEETEARIGSDLYFEIREILNHNPTKFDLSGDFFDGDDEEIFAFTRFLSDDKPSFISPCSIDWSVGEPVHFFSNVDVLTLPLSCTKDVSGLYDNDDGDLLYVKRVGAINAYGESETLAVDIGDGDSFDEIITATESAINAIKAALLAHIEDLHLFMLPPEWEDRGTYPADPNLPPRITLEQDSGELALYTPSFTRYSNFMDDEEMRMAYFKIRSAVSTWFNLPRDHIKVSLKFGGEIAGFKVADNVWVEALRDENTATQGKNNRFWWCHDFLKSMMSREQNAQTVASWLREEGATSVAYYSLVEHDAGNEVAYSVSVFKDRKRIMMFMISAFDIEAGFTFLEELERALGFTLVHSGEKEDDWGVVEFSDDLFFRVIEAPKIPVGGFSLIGLYFKINGHLKAIKPTMYDVNMVPELLNLGLNAPLPFTGVISTPCYMKTDDLNTPLLAARQSVQEAQEDGLSFSDKRLAEKLTFDLASFGRSQGEGVTVLSLMLLNISQNTLFDYAISWDFPVGEIQNEQLLRRLNALYPGANISHIVMVPLLDQF